MKRAVGIAVVAWLLLGGVAQGQPRLTAAAANHRAEQGAAQTYALNHYANGGYTVNTCWRRNRSRFICRLHTWGTKEGEVYDCTWRYRVRETLKHRLHGMPTAFTCDVTLMRQAPLTRMADKRPAR